MEIIYITTTTNLETIRQFARDLDIPFPVGIDYNRKVSKLFNVKIEPQTIVLDGGHVIRGAILGGVTAEELDEILGHGWPAAVPGESAMPTSAEPGDPRDLVSPEARCPVCGMFVAKYQVWLTRIEDGKGGYHDFDGVKDMLAYHMEPEKYGGTTDIRQRQLWLKDYYSLGWLDARQAYYVIGSDVYGPMGHEFIPFTTRAGAESFMADHHGKRIMTFDEITPELVEELRGSDRMKHGGN